MGKHIPLILAVLTLVAITACGSTSPGGGGHASPSPGHAQAASRVKQAVQKECRSLDPDGTATCHDVTGVSYDGSALTIKTKLYPKGENKDAAQEVGLFVVAAVECGADVGAKYTSIDVLAANGEPLLSSFRPPLCQ